MNESQPTPTPEWSDWQKHGYTYACQRCKDGRTYSSYRRCCPGCGGDLGPAASIRTFGYSIPVKWLWFLTRWERVVLKTQIKHYLGPTYTVDHEAEEVAQ